MRKPLRRLAGLLAPMAVIATVVALAPSTASAAGLGYALTYTTLPNSSKPVVRWNPCQSAITYKVNLADVPTALRPTILNETVTAVGRIAANTG
ncbi:MAG TPA: hypothetical protein VGN48_11970, partial [Pedococcus sp.]|nr:hypothetical protein [Pedococcus sp.]